MSPAESPADFAAAKALFFEYDGSQFHLTREGRRAEFDAYQVPDDLTDQWLRELTELRLAQLGGDRGWFSVQSLLNHGQLGHLMAVVAHPPTQGKPWQRRAYVQAALDYWDACAGWTASGRSSSEYTQEEIADALQWIRAQTQDLLSSYRLRGQRGALESVIEAVAVRAGSTPAEGGPSLGVRLGR